MIISNYSLLWHILSDVHHPRHAHGLRFFVGQQAQQATTLFSAAFRTRHEWEQFMLEYGIGQITDAQEMTATCNTCETNDKMSSILAINHIT